MTSPGSRLNVRADLSVDVDGVAVTVRGSGTEIDIETDELAAALAAARSAFASAAPGGHPLTAVRRAAERLDDEGLSVRVVSHGRPLAVIGRDADSRTSGIVLRTRRVQVLLPAAARRIALGAGGLALAGLLVRIARQRTRAFSS